MKRNYQIKLELPKLEEYKVLCQLVGWGEAINFEVAQKSLDSSVIGVTIRDKSQLIGMGRIIGDNAIYFYIQDVVVHPDYQGNGIGKMIMDELTAYLRKNVPDKAFIGLFASEGNDKFYKKFDFNNYAPQMTGMFTVISK